MFHIPVRGTHAHSWVMLFDEEEEAFEAYARVLPNNCLFLVDTYDTLQGVEKAIAVGRRLRQHGHDLLGIRLDSGDLAYLSVQARTMLDEAGFEQAIIVASNDLDERIIQSLKNQGATIGMWGVGTRLVTATDQPAMPGVYKLAAVRQSDGSWKYRVKLSEQAIKITNPGRLQIRRYQEAGGNVADAIYDQDHPPAGDCLIVDPMDMTRRKKIAADTRFTDLLVPVFQSGRLVYQPPSLGLIRERVQQQLASFHGGIKRFLNPHRYPVGLENGLFERKTDLIMKTRGVQAEDSRPSPAR
jgi:nicotinate phosphoribosyltransferase